MKTFPIVKNLLGHAQMMGLVFLISLFAFVRSAFSQAVAWELSGEPGNQASSTANIVGSNFNATNLTRGPGLSAAAAAGSMNASAWFSSSSPTTLADAIANNDYYEFTVSTSNCLFFNPTTILIVLRSSNTGPNTATLRCSSDGFSTDIGTVGVTTTSVAYSFSETISPNSNSVTYRLYGYGAAAGSGSSPGSGGTMRIGTSVVASDNDISVFATTTLLNITQVANITVNNGVAVPVTALTSNIPGATIAWTRSPEDIANPDLPTNGAGDIPAFTAQNSTGAPVTSTFTVTASHQGCNSTNMVFTITVNPPACTITASFLGNPSPCNDNGTPNDPSDDFFTQNIQGIFFNRPLTGNLQIVPGGDQIGTYSIPVQNIVGNSHIFTDVQFKADGTPTNIEMNFTAGPTCIDAATGPTVSSCSNLPSCEIIGFSFANIGPCNDNGTPSNAADDFFSVDVDVIYSNSEPFQTLFINGTDVFSGGSTLAQIGTNLTHTFNNLIFRADGQITEFTGAMQDGIANIICSLPGTGPAVNACAVAIPPNDACANAIPLQCNTSVNGTTIGATVETVPNCSNFGVGSPGVWYSFVGNGQIARLTGCGSNTNAGNQISIFTGDCGNLACVPTTFGAILCNGFSVHGHHFPTVAGTTYLVLVRGANSIFFGDFTLTFQCANPFPQDGAATVSCPSNVVTPVPPTYSTGFCQPDVPIVPTLFSVTQNPNPVTCEGTVTYEFNYLDCNLILQQWHFTYTVERQPFTVPVNGASTVACPNLAIAPTPPIVLSNCGETLTPTGPVITNNPNPITCEGTRTFMFTYTDCEGNTAQWSHVTIIERQPFTITTPNATTTVNCPANLPATVSPPTVTSNCGETLTPTGPVIVNAPNPVTCEGTRTFTFTYTDCEGNTTQWSHVFTVERQPFSVPANGASTVACPSQIVQPTPPVVTSNCGEVLTPTGPVILNNPNPITCEGTRTFTWTFTDCEGNTAQWSHVTTVERQPFSVPANGSATVNCPDQTDVQPTPPVVTSNCGEVLVPVISSSNKPGCEGNRNWDFTYTDCEGNTATWTFIYTVEYLDFTVPPSEIVTVECPFNASEPVPPLVLDACGKTVNLFGPVITSTDNSQGPAGASCEASRKYEWTFQDCEGNQHTWSKTFLFQYTADFFVYPDQTDYVSCLLYAQPPVPPTVYDNCGIEVKASLTNLEEDIAANGCSGWRRFTFTYTDCGGHSHPWVFTFFANDDQPPVGQCASLSVNNLSCIEDVPCPDTYDFGEIMEQVLAAGNFYDVCSGNELTVWLDGYSDLWQCADPDPTEASGDGTYTFGRSFYFSIADACGNEAASQCEVIFSGACLPIATFTQDDWGNAGDAPGSAVSVGTNDLAVITQLLQNSPLTIGGTARSLTLTNAQCVVDLLPGLGTPTRLANCHQTNCTGCNPAGNGGMKNALAANTIALTLNLRFNQTYNGQALNSLQNQSLQCVGIDQNILHCEEGTGCKLRLWDLNGTAHDYPYTIGGLLSVANEFLNGALPLNDWLSSQYATAINNSLMRVNEYWNPGQPPTACNGSSNTTAKPAIGGFTTDKTAPIGPAILLSPNPTSRFVRLQLSGMEDVKEVQLEIYNAFGQRLLAKRFGEVASLDEQFEIGALNTGVHVVLLHIGSRVYAQKLVVNKEEGGIRY